MIEVNRALAEKGDPDGVDFLLTQPALSPDAQRYFDAWADMADDRQMLSHGLGMAGGMLLHQPIGRDRIRREGRRAGYDGDALIDFISIVRRIDQIDRAENLQRQAKEIAAAAKKNAPKK